MNTFILGLLVGSAVVGVIAALVFINTKLHAVIGSLQLLIGSLQLLVVKVNKIEKTSEATMAAAESFIDALEQSADGMVFGGPRRPPMGGPKDDFQDLRETFEEGIRNLEDEPEPDDEEGQEPWKKGT